ncbi:MAG TPA: hypothetical protein VHY37_05430 [Tepidisphaeraceae bacterium]|nr:hypothetical protein [Tepidisphaeraceae bacterium]
MLIGAAALSAAIFLGWASVAHADQTQSAPTTGSTSNNGSGDWFRPGPPPPNSPAPSATSESISAGDFPSGFVSQWVDAATRASMTRAIFGQTEIDLAAAIRRAEEHFDRTKDYQKALDEEQQAYSDYLAARENALASLNGNPRYQELLRMEADLGRRLSAGRQNHDLSHDDILAMAELKLSYASEVRAIEVKALDADSAVKDARNKMVATSRTASQMRDDFEDALPDNADVVAARRNMENARIAYLTASAYLNASGIATAVATNYGYYANGPTQPRVYNYADPFGYGYGAGTISPFWQRY